MKRWLLDDDNEEATPQLQSGPQVHSEPKSNKSDVGLADMVVNRFYTPNSKNSSNGTSDSNDGGIKTTVSRRAKSILHQKSLDSDDGESAEHACYQLMVELIPKSIFR